MDNLYILTALHLWFVFSGWRDVDGNHVVAWGHVILTSVRHLLLGNNPIDLWKRRRADQYVHTSKMPSKS